MYTQIVIETFYVHQSIIKHKKQVPSKLFRKCQTITNYKKLVNEDDGSA